jgi:hypothetical protein
MATHKRQAINCAKAVPAAPRCESLPHFPLHPYRGVEMNAPAGPLSPFLRPPKSGHCFGRNELCWDGHKLRLGPKTGPVLATIEPDAKWPDMYRVRLPNGHLTDMVNISRARDAAVCLALAELNKQNHQERRVEAPPMRSLLKAAE